MQSIRQLYLRGKKFNPDRVLIAAVTSTQDAIPVLNREQLYQGLSSTGLVIGEVLGGIFGYKSASYAFFKYKENPLPGLGNPDLFLTGNFYRGITIKITGRLMSIYSTDLKNPVLENKYLNIFGLGPIAQRKYIKDFLQAAVNAKRMEALGL